MTEAPIYPDLSPWSPTTTKLPSDWMAFIAKIERETRGTPKHYILEVKYDGHGVGNVLGSWGLPIPVVVAGYLWGCDEQRIHQSRLADKDEVVGHMKEVLRYTHYIEDGDLLTLLTSQERNLNALLIAIAVYYNALRTLLRQKNERLYANRIQSQIAKIESVRHTLLNVTKWLGMWNLKREIEDRCEQLLKPYNFSANEQEHTQILARDKEKLDAVCRRLTALYEEVTNGPIMVTYTACGIAGLWRRQQDAHTTATTTKQQLTGFDLVTFDIVVPTVHDCYNAEGILRQAGHIQDRVTDHIAHPKSNGYSYIAFGLILKPTERQHLEAIEEDTAYSCQIQIGTRLMQAVMHYGCLYPHCYRLYLKKFLDEVGTPSTIQSTWNSEDGNVFLAIKEANKAISQHLVIKAGMDDVSSSKTVIVYDKNRRLFTLFKGATALDFAYELDPEIGERAVEAFINNRKAPLFRQLDAGDVVEIRISNETQVQVLWLDENYATTPQAKQHIKRLLEQRLTESAGYKQVLDVLRHYRYMLKHEDLKEHLHLLLKQHNLGTLDTYLARLTSTEEPPFTPIWAAQEIMRQIEERKQTQAIEAPSWVPVPDESFADTNSFRPQHLCSTCQPTHSRDTKIIGRIQAKSGDLIVHSVSCPHLTAHTASQRSTTLPMTWQNIPPQFRVSFYAKAQDRRGLILDITKQLRRHQCALVSIKADAQPKLQEAEIRLTIETHSDKEVIVIWQKLETIQSVRQVDLDDSATSTYIIDRLKMLRPQQQVYSSHKAVTNPLWDISLTGVEQRPYKLKNPFSISRPVTAKMFFGRATELNMMREELCASESGRALLLYGPLRSGKSSLCKNFLEQYVQPSFWHVYCSLQDATSQTETMILMQLAEKIGEEFHRQLGRPMVNWQDYNDSDPHVRFKHILQNYFAQVPEGRLILVLDEFGGAFESHKQHILKDRFFTFWRDLIAEHAQLSLLLVLPTSGHMYLRNHPVFSNAFSFAQELPIVFLDTKDARQLLVEPLKEQQILIHPNTVARAIELTGGNPYYMVLMGMQLIHLLNEEPQRQRVTDKDINLAVESIIGAKANQYFDFYRREIQSSEELHILEGIVELTSHVKQPATVPSKKIAAYLDKPMEAIRPHLERLQKGLILQEDRAFRSNPYYSFKIGLLPLWMMRNHGELRSVYK